MISYCITSTLEKTNLFSNSFFRLNNKELQKNANTSTVYNTLFSFVFSLCLLFFSQIDDFSSSCLEAKYFVFPNSICILFIFLLYGKKYVDDSYYKIFHDVVGILMIICAILSTFLFSIFIRYNTPKYTPEKSYIANNIYRIQNPLDHQRFQNKVFEFESIKNKKEEVLILCKDVLFFNLILFSISIVVTLFLSNEYLKYAFIIPLFSFLILLFFTYQNMFLLCSLYIFLIEFFLLISTVLITA